MMDVSDGIASDIRHIMEQSGVGAEIYLESVPTDYDIRFATTGGEDYELLIALPPDEVKKLASTAFASTLHNIGKLVPGKSTEIHSGWQHFKS